MTDRERLIEILKHGSCPSPYLCDDNCKYANLERCYEERTADLLLDHGVIVPQCKVGDTVYCIVFCPAINKLSVSKGFVREIRITKNDVIINIVDCEQIRYANLNINITCDDFGRTVFFTPEEAEKALKERANK